MFLHLHGNWGIHHVWLDFSLIFDKLQIRFEWCHAKSSLKLKSLSYQNKDGHAWPRPSFFWEQKSKKVVSYQKKDGHSHVTTTQDIGTLSRNTAQIRVCIRTVVWINHMSLHFMCCTGNSGRQTCHVWLVWWNNTILLLPNQRATVSKISLKLCTLPPFWDKMNIFRASIWNGQNAESPTAWYYLPSLQDNLYFGIKSRIHEDWRAHLNRERLLGCLLVVLLTF